ncbi:hypothetical protein P152DRAFT_449054 [Eremomyces bilateralis CBS 781.70]|uniref:Kinetochore protein NDC80 n=1 Tax=Eremomyces bilateralis CBS 781.70 TaxID=1392243 RepID=A0A6G1G4U4_9PEZI|nr:uncharacterized protein P152DRAFT_449054 [Eremomyces bilateralis CBS 781.70]KAF1812961.1 hypothetical protein P152DRAFT_449054 [Eremomyces bilateralis CBS 781.70]
MAHESGLFSVRRPRETLGGINHNVSAIPMPSSAMKRSTSQNNLNSHGRSTSTSRLSLAPNRTSQLHRSSSGSNLADGFASVHRNSTNNMMSSQRRSTFAPMAASTPRPPSFGLDLSAQRRSSIFSARPSGVNGGGGASRQSFFQTAPAPPTVPQDPRRLKDGSTRAQMAHELMEYLSENNFEMDMKYSLSAKAFTSPTQKDFNCMFQWLYKRLDPSYRFLKSIDAEVPPLLKQLRYPFEKNIMKSQIAAVGGNNWHIFLGLLHWMMQLARIMDGYASGVYDDACMEAGYDVTGDRIIFTFLSNAYRDWLSVEDDESDENAEKIIKPHIDVMAGQFEAANREHLEQVKLLEAESKALADQVEELGRGAEKMKKLDDTIKILEEDKGKFEQYNANMEAKVEKYQNRIQLLEEEIQKVEQEVDEADRERRELQDCLDSKGIPIQDIDRMNADRERMSKGVEATQVRLEEARRRVGEREAEAEAKLEELRNTMERYNSLGYEVGIIPSTASNAKGINYELVLSVSDGSHFSTSQGSQSEDDRFLTDAGNGYQPHQLLNLDLKGAVRNNINTLRKEIGERRMVATGQDEEIRDLVLKTDVELDERKQEVDQLEYRVKSASDEFEKTRELTNEQKMTSDTHVEKMERELASLRTGLSDSIQMTEQREMNTNLEYERLKDRADAVREELHTEIERILNDVIKFKVHIQKSLEDYEQFVAEEVEGELAGQEEQEYEQDVEMEEDE